MLTSMGLQRVRQDLVTEQQQQHNLQTKGMVLCPVVTNTDFGLDSTHSLPASSYMFGQSAKLPSGITVVLIS